MKSTQRCPLLHQEIDEGPCRCSSDRHSINSYKVVAPSRKNGPVDRNSIAILAIQISWWTTQSYIRINWELCRWLEMKWRWYQRQLCRNYLGHHSDRGPSFSLVYSNCNWIAGAPGGRPPLKSAVSYSACVLCISNSMVLYCIVDYCTMFRN